MRTLLARAVLLTMAVLFIEAAVSLGSGVPRRFTTSATTRSRK